MSRRVSMPAMPGTPWRREEVGERLGRAPVARPAGEVAHDDAAAERAPALVVVGVRAVVADVRVGERDDLARVARVGDDLLVAGERGVEHDLAGRDAASASSAPIASPSNTSPSRRTSTASRRGSLLRSLHRLRLAVDRRSVAPRRTVWRTRPVSFQPGERRVARPAGEPVGVDDPLLGGIEHAEVRGVARRRSGAPWPRASRPAIARRPPRQRAEHLGRASSPRLDQLGERDRERGLDAEHPRRRLLERCAPWSRARAARGRWRSRRSCRRRARR